MSCDTSSLHYLLPSLLHSRQTLYTEDYEDAFLVYIRTSDATLDPAADVNGDETPIYRFMCLMLGIVLRAAGRVPDNRSGKKPWTHCKVLFYMGVHNLFTNLAECLELALVFVLILCSLHWCAVAISVDTASVTETCQPHHRVLHSMFKRDIAPLMNVSWYTAAISVVWLFMSQVCFPSQQDDATRNEHSTGRAIEDIFVQSETMHDSCVADDTDDTDNTDDADDTDGSRIVESATSVAGSTETPRHEQGEDFSQWRLSSRTDSDLDAIESCSEESADTADDLIDGYGDDIAYSSDDSDISEQPNVPAHASPLSGVLVTNCVPSVWERRSTNTDEREGTIDRAPISWSFSVVDMIEGRTTLSTYEIAIVSKHSPTYIVAAATFFSCVYIFAMWFDILLIKFPYIAVLQRVLYYTPSALQSVLPIAWFYGALIVCIQAAFSQLRSVAVMGRCATKWQTLIDVVDSAALYALSVFVLPSWIVPSFHEHLCALILARKLWAHQVEQLEGLLG